MKFTYDDNRVYIKETVLEKTGTDVSGFFIYSINGDEFVGYEGLADIILKLSHIPTKDRRISILAAYADASLETVIPGRASASTMFMYVNNSRFYNPRNINPLVIRTYRPAFGGTNNIVASYKVGPYQVKTLKGGQWGVYRGGDLIKLHSDLAPVVYSLYNLGITDSGAKDLDSLLSFCQKWMALINKELINTGIVLKPNKETALTFSRLQERLINEHKR